MEQAKRNGTWKASFLGGILGGVAMAGTLIGAAALEGMDPLAPLRPFGETFAGDEPRGEGAGPLFFGLGLHLLFSGAVGVVLMSIVPRDFTRPSAAFICLGFTFVVMAVMTSYVLPALNPPLREAMPHLGGSWVLAHAVYGLTTGLFTQHVRGRGEVRVRSARLRERTA